jgi:CHAD domain-containing protein
MEQSGREFGLAVLEWRRDAFIKELVELSSNITDEGVHQARIESRRMRAALESFQDMLPTRPFDSVYKEVRHVTRILGTPRENAVSLGLIRELRKKRAAKTFCLKYLNKQFASRLKKKEKQLRKRLGHIDPNRFRSRFELLISAMLADNRSPVAPSATESSSAQIQNRASHPCQPTLFLMCESAVEQAARVLARFTESICTFSTVGKFHLAADEELHSLRIAAKRARYAMEMYSPIWPGDLAACIEKAREFQQSAGKFNDWCMLCQRLESEGKRLDSPDSVRLAFQIGKLSSYAEARKAEMKAPMRKALIEFQESLSKCMGVNSRQTKSDPKVMHRATRKPHSWKDSKDAATGEGAA